MDVSLPHSSTLQGLLRAGVQAALQLLQESLGLAKLYVGIFCQVHDTQNKLYIIFLVIYSWLYSSV